MPAGRSTRPTADRAREGLFSTLESLTGTLASTRVLDLYAGSGAVGLEALSRGAAGFDGLGEHPLLLCGEEGLSSDLVQVETDGIVHGEVYNETSRAVIPVSSALAVHGVATGGGYHRSRLVTVRAAGSAASGNYRYAPPDG